MEIDWTILIGSGAFGSVFGYFTKQFADRWLGAYWSRKPVFSISPHVLRADWTIKIQPISRLARKKRPLHVWCGGAIAGAAAKVLVEDGKIFWQLNLSKVESVSHELRTHGTATFRLFFDADTMSEDIKIQRNSRPFGEHNNDAIVFVQSAHSLIEALSHGGSVVVNAPEIVLSDGFPTSNKALSWEQVFDGREPILSNISNMRLMGEGASLLIEPQYGYVMTFRNCHNLLIKNLSIGHVDEGYCTGGVLKFEGCTNVRVEDCDLFGCGTYGVELARSASIELARCKIRDCSYGIARLEGCSDIIFSSCEFVNNRELDLISFSGSNEGVLFRKCVFEKNRTSKFHANDSGRHLFFFEKGSAGGVTVWHSRFTGNQVDNFSNEPSYINEHGNTFTGNRWKLNESKAI